MQYQGALGGLKGRNNHGDGRRILEYCIRLYYFSWFILRRYCLRPYCIDGRMVVTWIDVLFLKSHGGSEEYHLGDMSHCSGCSGLGR